MSDNQIIKKKYFYTLLVICILSLFMFIGGTNFNTRGEPREALVASSMLQTGNWTLPVTNQTDLAYKPPLFHWCVATISSIGGKVTEYTSRMPSAIALTLMVLAGYLFYAKRKGSELALLASLITLTNFEVHRAGTNCRVDMLLTAMMVIALYQLYRWTERRMKGIPWLGILCLSGAFLTKGPVGLVLPCLVTALFAWIRGFKFFTICWKYICIVLATFVLPLCWYYAAWKQGGDEFLSLVIEENVLRFLGKMTYASHENPWYYNIITLVSGFVPYTLLLVISLFSLKYSRLKDLSKIRWNKFVTYIKEMDDVRLFSLLSIVVMFVFYCIPKSKRSVYLLPIYPFVAYFIAEYLVYLIRKSPHVVKIFNGILASLCILLTVVFAIIRCGFIPHTIFHGKHALENRAYLDALESIPFGPSLAIMLIIVLPLIVGIHYFHRVRKIGKETSLMSSGIVMTIILFFALDGVYQPAILNAKSNKDIAMQLKEWVPEGPVYSYITRMAEGNRMHPFTINFYLKDRVIPFIDNAPQEGYLLLGEKEYDSFIENYSKEYTLDLIPNTRYKSCDTRDMTSIYRFKRN